MTTTNEGMTAALAPVREELEALELTYRQTDTFEGPFASGVLSAVKAIRSALNRIHPEPDVLAALGMVAIGMLKELMESEETGHIRAAFSASSGAEDWAKRADALLAAADQRRI